MTLRALLCLLTLSTALLVNLPAPAAAQDVIATVNRVPITNFDVSQRIRLAALTERRRLDNRSALQELIDDQVKLAEARRIGYRVTDEGVDQEFNRMARAGGQSATQFSDALRRAGIEPSALRDKLRANAAWQVLLRDQARRGQQVSAEEIDKAAAERARKRGDIIDYELQSVIFIVGSGASPGERERAASAARSRFTGCGEGMESFRQLKDVAVRPIVLRSTEGMSDALKSVLAKTPVGRMTQPYRTDQGIELVAVCSRKERDTSGSQRAEVAAELAEKRVMDNARNYLAELRKKVDIRMGR
jgi:peptidyl-prolyl cis-trans isomerase SurA